MCVCEREKLNDKYLKKKCIKHCVLYRNLVTLQAYLRPVHFMGS